MVRGPKSRVPFGMDGFAHAQRLSLVLATVLNESHHGEDGHAEEYVLHAWKYFEGTKFGN
jgi:hypothetical protein